MDEKVENELGVLVDILQREVPPLEEVRIFGSYNRGDWNPEKSDVDVFALTGDESYFVGRTFSYGVGLSDKQLALRKTLDDELGEFKERISLHLCTLGDVEIMKRESSQLLERMQNGRLIYSKKAKSFFKNIPRYLKLILWD